MTGILQLTMERVQDNMDEILTNFKADAKITVLVRTPGKPSADFCLTSDTLDEVAAMIERRKAETPPPQTNMTGEDTISLTREEVAILLRAPNFEAYETVVKRLTAFDRSVIAECRP